jgi:hypothetical protein
MKKLILLLLPFLIWGCQKKFDNVVDPDASQIVAPVISNLIAPDSVTIGNDSTKIFLSITVWDQNGLNDISSVFFNSYIPPDGHASSANPIKMYDDGTHGDKTAGDGIYSTYVILPSTGVPHGTFRWDFFAQDKSGLLSNKISHNVVVQ